MAEVWRLPSAVSLSLVPRCLYPALNCCEPKNPLTLLLLHCMFDHRVAEAATTPQPALLDVICNGFSSDCRLELMKSKKILTSPQSKILIDNYTLFAVSVASSAIIEKKSGIVDLLKQLVLNQISMIIIFCTVLLVYSALLAAVLRCTFSTSSSAYI